MTTILRNEKVGKDVDKVFANRMVVGYSYTPLTRRENYRGRYVVRLSVEAGRRRFVRHDGIFRKIYVHTLEFDLSDTIRDNLRKRGIYLKMR